MIKKVLNYAVLLVLISSCSYQADKSEHKSSNKFADPNIRKISDWQDKRNTDSLIVMLKDNDSIYQQEAALALASVQDNKAIPELANLLNHSSDKAKKMAAFALGQTYDSIAFSHLIKALENSNKPEVNYYLLEAAGKTVPRSELDKLLSVNVGSKKGSAGMAWALYRAGIRNIFNDKTTQAALNILDSATSEEALLASAHYLARLRDISIPDWGYVVLKNKIDIKDPEIRMAIAMAYRNIPPQISASVYKTFLQDEDYRVIVNAIRSMPEEVLKDMDENMITSLLQYKNPNTAIAMAEKIEGSNNFPVEQIKKWIEKVENNRVRSLLFKAALSVEPNNNQLVERIKETYLSTESPYYKAGLLEALSQSLRANEFIITETFRADHPAVSTAGILALSQLRRDKNFPDPLKTAFADIMKQAIESGDAAMIDIASAVIRDPSLNFQDAYENLDFLYNAKKKLSLPKENETLQSLERTIAFLEGKEYKPVENEYNHPINWDKLRLLESPHEASIKTSKGNIDIVLFTKEAPGSVLNFVELSRAGYYNNKVFHRVVPNFVVQGGGNRGDGWGGEDYSIRSEFADRKYTTGTIGMASAGKDTEGTQWFITHSPTPHLDGRYTIFAQVKDGMDVVHHLQQGDTIYSVTVKE